MNLILKYILIIYKNSLYTWVIIWVNHLLQLRKLLFIHFDNCRVPFFFLKIHSVYFWTDCVNIYHILLFVVDIFELMMTTMFYNFILFVFIFFFCCIYLIFSNLIIFLSFIRKTLRFVCFKLINNSWYLNLYLFLYYQINYIKS